MVWPDEIAEWAHTTRLRYTVLDGSPMDRTLGLTPAAVDSRDITIIGLDIVQWLVSDGRHAPGRISPLFDLLVIDEVSRLRNPSGERAKALAKVAHRWKMIWGLTGTLRPSGAGGPVHAGARGHARQAVGAQLLPVA